MPAKTISSPSTGAPAVGTIIDNGTLELVEVLGVGGYGVVYRAVDLCSSRPKSYAVKVLPASAKQSARQRQLHLREITLHQLSSSHPHVVTLHRVLEEGSHTFLVMEYAPDGDLFTQILDNSRYLGDDALIRHIFLQILDAVEHCHSMGIYHRDLKPENVLTFNSGTTMALTDFGLATVEKASEEFRTGSVYHMSPECQGGSHASGSYSPKANDIWSLAIVLLNIATGRNPWKAALPSDPTFRAYLQNPTRFLPTVLPISNGLNNILVQMLAVDWRDRLPLREVRRAIASLDTFYCDGVVFEGSMARCAWEAGMEIESESSTKGGPSAVIPDEDLKSHWSQDSSSRMPTSATLETPAVDWMDFSGSDTQWDTESSVTSASGRMYENFSGSDRSRTPPSTRSSLSSEGSEQLPSLPGTPDSHNTTFANAASYDFKPRARLTIDTNFDGHHFQGPDQFTSISSESSIVMQTAIDSSHPYSYEYYLPSAIPSPSKHSHGMPSAHPYDAGEDLDMDDVSSSWECASDGIHSMHASAVEAEENSWTQLFDTSFWPESTNAMTLPRTAPSPSPKSPRPTTAGHQSRRTRGGSSLFRFAFPRSPSPQELPLHLPRERVDPATRSRRPITTRPWFTPGKIFTGAS